MLSPPLAIPRFRTALTLEDLAAGAWALSVARRGGEEAEEAVAAFEAEFARTTGRRFGVSMASARGALLAILGGLGLQPGDEVLFPGFGYFAMPGAVRQRKWSATFADVVPGGFLLDPERAAAAFSPRTRAVVPTHLFGGVCALQPLMEAAAMRGIHVVEDGSQALGASYLGRPVGSFGKASVFTFGITKHFTALSGAMVTTDDEVLAARLREVQRSSPMTAPLTSARELALGASFLVAGRPLPFTVALRPWLLLGDLAGRDLLEVAFGETMEPPAPSGSHSGVRARPGPVQAAVGRAQLARLSMVAQERMRLGRMLVARLQDSRSVEVPAEAPGASGIWSSFAVKVKGDRDRLGRTLRLKGVDCTSGFMQNCPALPGWGWKGDCPESEDAASRILHLPLYPGMTEEDLDRIALTTEGAGTGR